jgi:hypothetical protein
MSEQNNKLPLGSLLQNAGLISPEQLQSALELQSQYTQMKLGEIFVLQEGIRVKTIDFFVEKWHELIDQGQQFPLGYYLKIAFLLNEQQVNHILQEQKNNQQKFGEIAVQKGWIKQDTIDFFLSNLSLKSPPQISLTSLEEYNREALHLERKYANYALILTRILAWTGGNIILTKTIAQVFARANFNIPNEAEINAVDQFVEASLIRKWQTSEAAAYIRTVRQNLVENPRCDAKLLLKEYQQILLSENREYRNTPEQNELLLLGLVVSAKDKLYVANIIYQQVFNQDFITQEINKIQPAKTIIPSIETPTAVTSITEYTSNIPAPTIIPAENNPEIEINPQTIETNSSIQRIDTSVSSPEPLTRMSSLITLAAIALLIPLFLTINNYYSSLSKQNAKISVNSAKKVSELQQFCSELNFTNSNSSLELISQLEVNQAELSQNFPTNCEIALNRFRVIAAPILGKESRILEAIRHLCKIPPDSEMYIDAEIWLKRWYNSANWGEETKSYLEEQSKHNGTSCPAAHFMESES